MPFDIKKIRAEFPILNQQINNHPLIYLDNAATTQKPRAVIKAITDFYTRDNANVHRSMHVLAERATLAYENARQTVKDFIGAKHQDEIIFTKNCTEALNLIAHSWGNKNLKKGDGIVLSLLEHHSNIVPWLQLKERQKIDIKWLEIDESGLLNISQLENILAKEKIKLISVTGQSNVLGVSPDLKRIIATAHEHNVLVCVDAAQLIAHHKVDVIGLDCDFLTFSGHKIYGPLGIGVLYAKRKLIEKMDPFLGGGSMIHEVFTGRFTPAEAPEKFEAGTPPIAAAHGLAAALKWIQQFDSDKIQKHESELINFALNSLQQIDGIRILGPADANLISGCISFDIPGLHPHDLTFLLGEEGICLRAGHHCAQPLHKRLGINASTRLSVGIYNTGEEISILNNVIIKIISRLRK